MSDESRHATHATHVTAPASSSSTTVAGAEGEIPGGVEAPAEPPASAATPQVAPAGPAAPPERPESLSGVRKAAVFVLSLEEDDASEILRSLSDEELSRITAEIASLGVVEKDAITSVMQEFRELEQIHSLARQGGVLQAARLIERSFPAERAERIKQLLSAQRQSLPFVFLERVEIETLMAFLEDEHPQTLAVVLAHMTPAKAADVLERLPPQDRKEVLERIAALDGANAEALEQVQLALRRHLETVHYESLGDAGGVKAVAGILRAAPGGGTAFLDDIRQDQPELAEEIGKHLFVFEDLVGLDDRAFQVVLKEADMHVLALALKNASDALRVKVLDNLSRRGADDLRTQMAILGPVKFLDVQEAQRSILQIVLSLEQSGELFISGRGCEENRIFY